MPRQQAYDHPIQRPPLVQTVDARAWTSAEVTSIPRRNNLGAQFTVLPRGRHYLDSPHPQPTRTSKGWAMARATNSRISEKEPIWMANCFMKIPPRLYKQRKFGYNGCEVPVKPTLRLAHYTKILRKKLLTQWTIYIYFHRNIWWNCNEVFFLYPWLQSQSI